MDSLPVAATNWATRQLNTSGVEATPLTGGMTSQMMLLTDATGARSVLRRITNEPWRSHGPELVRREAAACVALSSVTGVPAPDSIAVTIDEEGVGTHLMSHLPGSPRCAVEESMLAPMAELLSRIHVVRTATVFREYQSWAWPAKWVVPEWSRHRDAWARSFEVLADPAPSYDVGLLHRDYSHRNLLWAGDAIVGVVDWVETSMGPAWLDVGHAATNLAVAGSVDLGDRFLDAYAAVSGSRPEAYWLIMDAVGFLPPPGRRLMFGAPDQVRRLDEWCAHLIRRFSPFD